MSAEAVIVQKTVDTLVHLTLTRERPKRLMNELTPPHQ
jgi:hypothetical protein